MSVESWDPNADAQKKSYALNHEVLLNIIAQRQKLPEQPISEYFDAEELQIHSAMMKQDRESWLAAVGSFSEPQLLSLIEFLTLAEKQISSWQAGADSPVIYIVKFMRQNKMPLSKDMLLWIKANSDNRFLPNGPL
ncbi:hypothetical protein [Pseudoteredinibacter isoporae]|uniref:Uncharacterized protein n=1 Tax=Pseudoteredinibacter isoporae TaxID=570281 RepID=A0A7X0JSC5_9GAMM|nr:hypothetical protein [Pseudoteredinibacter isoporae]MBB6520778.1 hypothetical protein [Pseudoteredinibacter isoporae]NHO86344.1 hypothetical protein [Pseudoteredinibacter isoporae]NIB25204.1 hypothetical protein [Pseudoteredinibacter isoporae]